MDDIPNMHVPPNAGQVSQYSELFGATVPATKPFYPLPEKTYYPEPYSAKTLPPSMHPTMNPVIFDNPIYGGLGVPVIDLSKNAFPPADMTDGTKIVFGSYPHMKTILLRFMWPGYFVACEEYPIKFDPITTTLAELAGMVGAAVQHYMKRLANSTKKPNYKAYAVGPGAINVDQVYLAAIVNTYSNTWQVKLFIKT